jgi:hypothetical protein
MKVSVNLKRVSFFMMLTGIGTGLGTGSLAAAQEPVTTRPQGTARPVVPIVLGDSDFHVEVIVKPGHLLAAFGPRFDNTAMVSTVRLKGRSYLASNGLVDEFGIDGIGVLGFEEAWPGGTFLKIGVGELVRPDDEEYKFWNRYSVRRSLPVEVERKGDTVAIHQRAALSDDYVYDYIKRYLVFRKLGVLVIEYKLQNLGRCPFTFNQYNHNWFACAGRTTAPPYFVETAFDVSAVNGVDWLNRSAAADSWTRLRIAKPVGAGVVFESASGGPVESNKLIVGCPGSGQHVEVSGDFDVERFSLYADQSAICPEVFKQAELHQGESQTWRRYYRFARNDASRFAQQFVHPSTAVSTPVSAPISVGG